MKTRLAALILVVLLAMGLGGAMAEKSAPWDGISTGDAGPYSYQQWATFWRAGLGLGAHRADAGVLLGSDTTTLYRRGLEVDANSPVAMNVKVQPGAALVQGTMYINDAVATLTIAANGSGNPRIDTIVLRKSVAAQTIRLAVLQGTPGASPSAPALTQNSLTWEIPLADVTVASGAASVAASVIQPVATPANGADGVYIYGVLNNSGVTLNTGDVVVWDPTANRAVKTTTTASDPNVAGVWVGRTANGGYGQIQTGGIGLVRVDAAVVRGTVLAASTTAGRAKARGTGVFAYTLEATSAAGLVTAVIGVQNIPKPAFGFNTLGITASVNSTTYVDVPNGTVVLTTHGGDVDVILNLSLRIAGVAYGSFVSSVFNVNVDGVAMNANQIMAHPTSAAVLPMYSRYRAGGISAAAHTFQLQVKSTTGPIDFFSLVGGGGSGIQQSFGIQEVY